MDLDELVVDRLHKVALVFDCLRELFEAFNLLRLVLIPLDELTQAFLVFKNASHRVDDILQVLVHLVQDLSFVVAIANHTWVLADESFKFILLMLILIEDVGGATDIVRVLRLILLEQVAVIDVLVKMLLAFTLVIQLYLIGFLRHLVVEVRVKIRYFDLKQLNIFREASAIAGRHTQVAPVTQLAHKQVIEALLVARCAHLFAISHCQHALVHAHVQDEVLIEGLRLQFTTIDTLLILRHQISDVERHIT